MIGAAWAIHSRMRYPHLRLQQLHSRCVPRFFTEGAHFRKRIRPHHNIMWTLYSFCLDIAV